MSDNESTWDDDIVDEPVEVVEKPKPKAKAPRKPKAKPAPVEDTIEVRVVYTNPYGRPGDIITVNAYARNVERFLAHGVIEKV